MADSKLTALGTIAEADDADLIYVVDVSDTTDDPAGSSKAIAVSDLIPGGGHEVLISRTTLTADTTKDITCPGGYDRYRMEGFLRSNKASTDIENSNIYFNADTVDAHYLAQYNGASNGSTQVSEIAAGSRFVQMPANNSPAGSYAHFTAYIESPDDTNQLRAVQCNHYMRRAAASSVNSIAATFHDTMTAALTEINIHSQDGGGMTGEIRLIGINYA